MGDAHARAPDASFDGGTLDCGNGLLLLIRRHIDPLLPGQLLEILSAEPSVAEDLPAWCRLTGNQLVARAERGERTSYLVAKGARAHAASAPADAPARAPRPSAAPASPAPPVAAALPPLAVMGVGSWPRPRWVLRALHERLEGRLSEEDFEELASDAVRLAVAAQERAGLDVISDGEQRRDNYASFVGARLENCQLVPLTDLLPYVDDPAAFAAELRALDVPAAKVRHPAVLGKLRRSRPLAAHEVDFARTLTPKPIKVALPGPYLLTRTMWLECVAERAYASRRELAEDVTRILREEIEACLAAGAALVQLDEPVLSDVVYGAAAGRRTFMCGALGEKLAPEQELAFAEELLAAVVRGLPRERLALHVCRGNWTPDESAALSGDYGPLAAFLANAPVGTLVLELCTPRAGDPGVLRELPDHLRVGFGVIDQKSPRVEGEDELARRIDHALELFGPERILLNPDCGFATFADNPVASAETAERKLAGLVRARDRVLRGGG